MIVMQNSDESIGIKKEQWQPDTNVAEKAENKLSIIKY